MLGVRSLISEEYNINLNEIEKKISKPTESFEEATSRVLENASRREIEHNKWHMPKDPVEAITPRYNLRSRKVENSDPFEITGNSRVSNPRNDEIPKRSESPLPAGFESFGIDEKPIIPEAPRRRPFEFGSSDMDPTNEQNKTRVVQQVMGNMRNVREFTLAKESEDEEKADLIQDIEILIEIIREDGHNVDIRVPTMDDSLKHISDVRRALAIKNSRLRSYAFAEEVILGASQILEYCFDGKKQYFGKTINLTGWSDTVNVKLRRMRYDTSTLVNSFIQPQRGPGWRILIELLPSLIVFSRMNKTRSNDDLFTRPQMNAAMDRIRN